MPRPAIARSDREVHLQEGTRQLAGRGMEYHHDQGLFILREQVRGRFELGGAQRK